MKTFFPTLGNLGLLFRKMKKIYMGHSKYIFRKPGGPTPLWKIGPGKQTGTINRFPQSPGVPQSDLTSDASSMISMG